MELNTDSGDLMPIVVNGGATRPLLDCRYAITANSVGAYRRLFYIKKENIDVSIEQTETRINNDRWWYWDNYYWYLGKKVRVGIIAPKKITVHRKELYEVIQKEQATTTQEARGDFG